jgi:hypothetical protein
MAASIWDLAVLNRTKEPEDAYDAYVVTILAVPGGKAVASAEVFKSLEEGAAWVMQDGFEPFGASRMIDPEVRDSLWFRREVKSLPRFFRRFIGNR